MKKQPGSNTGTVLVTFSLPAAVGAVSGSVCGEFNQWLPHANPLVRSDDGILEATVELEAGRAFRFRYLLDEQHWENDWDADGYVANDFGGDDSVLDLTTIENLGPSKATKRRPSTTAAAPAAKRTTSKQRAKKPESVTATAAPKSAAKKAATTKETTATKKSGGTKK